MEQTAIKTGPAPLSVPAPAPMTTPAGQPKPQLKANALKVLHALASLRITVVLFAISMVLVFWGTLAQRDAGIWTVVSTYFRGFVVWVPLKVILFNQIDDLATRIPFPGGMTIGIVMMVNLLAAHAVRFKLAWNRAGILLTHAGIIIMMLGELLTGLFAVEQQMSITTGQTVGFVYNTHKSELAIVRQLDAKKDDVTVVPGSILTNGAKIQDPRVPFEIEVLEYMVNSNIEEAKGPSRATKGLGLHQKATPLPETAGADPDQQVEIPSVYVRLSHGGKDLGVWLFSVAYSEFLMNSIQEIAVDGKTYRVGLRFQQSTRPYSIRLDKVTQKFHLGTRMAKDYRSYIHLSDPTAKVEQDVQIYMNAPMFYRGETFYQSGVNGQDPRDPEIGVVTVFQVVNNPGWALPYLSCAVVAVGLLAHFGYTLFRFVKKRGVL